MSLFDKVICAGGIARQGPDQGEQVISRVRYLPIPGKRRVGGEGRRGRCRGRGTLPVDILSPVSRHGPSFSLRRRAGPVDVC